VIRDVQEMSMEYHAPATLKEAVKLLGSAKGTAHILAGGTDLLVRMRSGFTEPNLIVDIKRIEDMRKIRHRNKGFRIGAAVSAAEMGEDKKLVKAWPGVVEAANLIGSTQIQGRATVAGNLCNASPAADSVPALAAVGAKALIRGPKGTRKVAVEKVCTGPGKTILKKSEILEAIDLPECPKRTGDAYLRFIPRTEMDIAVAGAAVCLSIDKKGVCTAAKVVLGAVAPTILVVPKAAKALIGSEVDDEALEKLSAICSASAKPIDDKRGTKDYRCHIAGVLARRAAIIARERARGKS
jgi:carbon-monoxide dehydrogenase medium subunit